MSNEIAVDTDKNIIDWEKRALRAEAKIVADKKEAKAEPKEPLVPIEEEKQEEKKEEAPAKEDRTASLEKELASLKEEQGFKANQEETNMMSMWGSEKPSETNVYNISDIEKMSQAEYNKAKDRIDSGEASVDRNL